MSSTNDCPESSWMNPSCGIAPVQSHGNCRRTLDRTGGVIDRLIGHVAVAGVGAIVAATVPRDADARGDQLVAFFHTGAFDAAQHVEIPSREHLFKTPSIHPASYR